MSCRQDTIDIAARNNIENLFALRILFRKMAENALVKLQDRIKTKRNIIVSFEDEAIIEKDSLKIEVIPAWKFILKKV